MDLEPWVLRSNCNPQWQKPRASWGADVRSVRELQVHGAVSEDRAHWKETSMSSNVSSNCGCHFLLYGFECIVSSLYL